MMKEEGAASALVPFLVEELGEWASRTEAENWLYGGKRRDGEKIAGENFVGCGAAGTKSVNSFVKLKAGGDEALLQLHVGVVSGQIGPKLTKWDHSTFPPSFRFRLSPLSFPPIPPSLFTAISPSP